MFLHDIALVAREGMLCIVKLIAKIPVIESKRLRYPSGYLSFFQRHL